MIIGLVIEWNLALVDRIDMLRVEVGMRRAAERLG